MDGANPYQPPQAPIADGGGAALAVPAAGVEPSLPPWRLEGRTLFVRHGATLPDICLYSGEPTAAGQRVRYLLSWTPIWFRVMAVFGPGAALLAYVGLRWTSTVSFGLGTAGRRRHGLMLLLIVAAVIDAGVVLDRPAHLRGALGGLMFLLFVGLLIAAAAARVFEVVRIDRRYARLRIGQRAAAAFARLPAPGPRD